MCDEEETVCQLLQYLNPQAQHVLDWFHITMRITVPGQFIKGLVKLDAKIGGDIERELESVKWYLRTET